MATVTVLTAARMLAIEAASVVDGDIVGDNLILTKHDGSTINAGNVRGPQGIQGPAGDVSTAQLEAAVNEAVPVGTIVDYISTTVPTGWLALTGQTITGGQTLYPLLWAVLPAGMKSGSNIILPDTQGRVTVGRDSGNIYMATVGLSGGSYNNTLTQAQLPAVGVTVNPPSTTISINPPAVYTDGQSVSHTHTYTAPTGSESKVQAWISGAYSFVASGDTASYSTGSASQSHTHLVDIPAFNATVNIASFESANLGSGDSFSITQPYVVFVKIIKAE